MRLVKNEHGQALVITTICMSILMGMAGLAIEIGLLYRTRQNVQIAADAAAQAAALDYHYNQDVANAQIQGQSASTTNGFTDGTNGISVAVNLPPTSGSETGDTNYAEAIVTYPNPVSFMRLFGHNTVSVTARAVAGPSVPGEACIWLMGETGTDLTMQGSYYLNTPNCGIYVNSTSTSAVQVTGNGGTVDAAFLDVRGDVTPQHQTTPTPITTGVSSRTPPINPTQPDCSTSSSLTINPVSGATTISINGSTDVSSYSSHSNVCFSAPVTISGTVSLPGTSAGVAYVFESGVTIATGAIVTFGNCTGCVLSTTAPVLSGPGVTITGATMDLQGGTLTQQSSSLMSIYAPANVNSPTNGVAIYQPSSNSTTLQLQFGSNNEVLDGWIYAPSAQIFLHDSGGGVTATGIVAQGMTSQTTELSILSYDQYNADTAPDPIITLVE